MSRRSAFILLVVLALGSVFAAEALADSTPKQVGLVIAFPDGSEYLQVVSVPGSSTTFDVLQAAAVNLASQDTAYGPAICGINDAGCPVTDCFCDATHFWAYYHLKADGTGWAQASEGVGAYVPASGDVEGLAWSGFDANYNPTVQPPAYTFAQIVAATTPAPVNVPEPATLVLLGSGLVGLAGYIRWRVAR